MRVLKLSIDPASGFEMLQQDAVETIGPPHGVPDWIAQVPELWSQNRRFTAVTLFLDSVLLIVWLYALRYKRPERGTGRSKLFTWVLVRLYLV